MKNILYTNTDTHKIGQDALLLKPDAQEGYLRKVLEHSDLVPGFH